MLSGAEPVPDEPITKLDEVKSIQSKRVLGLTIELDAIENCLRRRGANTSKT